MKVTITNNNKMRLTKKDIKKAINEAFSDLVQWENFDNDQNRYDSYVVTQTFCEQAKVKKTSSNTSGSATMKL